MSSNRRSSRITEDEINELVAKLQTLLPESYRRARTAGVPASKILKETCSYIKRLNREMDDLSERLSQLLASVDSSAIDADILRSLLQQ